MDDKLTKKSETRMNRISLAERKTLIRQTPGFAQLEDELMDELANAVEEIHVKAETVIVKEGDLVDSVYLIAEGTTEVTRQMDDAGKPGVTLLAVLNPGESIGLKESGLYSDISVRTATVTASSFCILLKLSLTILQKILQKDPDILRAMQENLASALKMRLIKESAPFARFSNERLATMANAIEEVSFKAGTPIFTQGEVANNCYMIYEGSVEISRSDHEGVKKEIATLGTGTLFGEAAFLTHGLRNATACALTACKLLVLDHALLLELGDTYKDSMDSDALMFLLADKNHPVRAQNILYKRRILANGELVVTLKNPATHLYYQLNEQEWFIWEMLNGNLTPPEIINKACQKFPELDADDVTIILQDMLDKRFAYLDTLNKPDDQDQVLHKEEGTLGWMKWVYFLKKPDKLASFFYKHGGSLLTSIPALCCYLIIILAGLVGFPLLYPAVIQKIPEIPLFPWWLLIAISMAMLYNLAAPLIKIMAIKRVNHESARIALIWQGLGPSLYVDTSDLLMGSRKSRIFVGIISVITLLLAASLLSCYAWYYSQAGTAVFSWLCALILYFKALRALDPMQNAEGYNLLVDLLDTPKLRKHAFAWLSQSRTSRKSSVHLFQVSLVFWLACLLYLLINLLLVIWLSSGIINQWPSLASLQTPALVLVVIGFFAEVVFEWQYQKKSAQIFKMA